MRRHPPKVNSESPVPQQVSGTRERSSESPPTAAFTEHCESPDDQFYDPEGTEAHGGGARHEQARRLESLGQLAGGIAHDFNNLLAVILNYAAFVSEDLAPETESSWSSVRRESSRNDVGQITLAAERAAELTRQLLAFARQEVIRPGVLDLNEVVAAMQEMLHRTIGEHVEVVTSLAADLLPILADRGQLEQVLVNLAVNARDAMPNGGTLTIGTANIAPEADATKPVRNVRLSVSDTGTGMSDDVAHHIFDPFFSTKSDAGTGLGLATVYGIVTQADGHIEVCSELGAGTTFNIDLPVTAELAAIPVPIDAYQRNPKGETVLVVEDEEALREVTKRMLVRSGYHVLTAANGPEALELASHHEGEIHLLVTDVVMPLMLGKEVAEKILLIKPEIEVLFMSGYARPVLTSQGRLDPNVCLVEKPFSATELLKQVALGLNGHFRGFETIPAKSA
jgi:CheY-like chemotaxis protein